MRLQLKRADLIYGQPTLKLNKDIKEFIDFTIGDINLENYTYHDKIHMDISI